LAPLGAKARSPNMLDHNQVYKGFGYCVLLGVALWALIFIGIALAVG
jgi:hypothetical protein